MRDRSAAPKQNINLTHRVFLILLIPISILIFIGDTVRKFLYLNIQFFAKAIYLFFGRIHRIQNVTLLLKENILKRISHVNALKTRSLSLIHIPSLSLLRFKFTVPTIQLPQIHVPKPITSPVPSSSINDRFRAFQSFVIGVIFTIVCIFFPYTTYTWLKSLPNPQLLNERDIEVSTKILDRSGIPLYEIYADQNRTPIPLSEMPKYVINATIAIEDKDFYRHNGFSFSGTLRAIRETLLNHKLQGGSTITQQLIKSALLTPEISLTRKFKELLLAFWAERIYSKDKILEMYLNQIPYGHSAWGIEAASQTYFGKQAKNLSLAQAALLAGLPVAPTRFSPYGTHPEETLKRQADVLRRMREDHYISTQEEQEALAEPIHFKTPIVGIRAPHFVMYVKDLLEKRYGTRMVEQGGLRVITTLDSTIQEKADDIVKRNIDNLKQLNVGNGAVIITQPKSGEILAMVGSKDYFDVANQGNVNVTTSLRQPGSSIKVVTYAAALESGFTAASILQDTPVVYIYPGSPSYIPNNYDNTFHGSVTLRSALGNSYNIPAVKILQQISVPTMIEKGKKMGITSWNDDKQFGLSLTLGGGAVTLVDMSSVFGTLANNGEYVEPQSILKVTDYTGKVLEEYHAPNGIQAVKPAVAWIISNILSDNSARIQAFGPNSSLVIPGKTVSVKTGTSNDKRDNLTIGYTPSYVVAVWVGNNDNSPMNPLLTSGITGAAPIWHEIMTELIKNKPDEIPTKPNDVISIPCYFGKIEYFMKGTEPASKQCGPFPTPSISPSPTP